MSDAPFAPTALVARPLRALTVDPQSHPRGQPHLSAASGLVCAHSRAYVIADDEHHLAVFRDLHAPGALHRVFAGDLPRPKKARKRIKPDLETLLLLPSPDGASNGGTALLALGSGSRANRNLGVMIALDAAGEPCAPVRGFNLNPLYEPLRQRLGEINIEGALLLGDQLVLLNRGVPGRSDNAAARYPLREFVEVIDGQRLTLEPASLRRYELGFIDGVALAFTDGAALPDGGWLFSAVAENTRDSYADGPCSGSVIGWVDGRGDLQALHRLALPFKIEGIAVNADSDGMALCLVTDADDPAQSSQLLLARLPPAPAG